MIYVLNGSIFNGDIRIEPGSRYIINRYSVGSINHIVRGIRYHDTAFRLTSCLKNLCNQQ